MPHGSPEALCIAEQILSVVIAVLLHTGEEPGHGLHERIVVHDSIPFVALQPVSGIAVVLCQNNSLRIGLFYRFPEFLPEMMVEFLTVTQISCHIQSPSIHIVGRRYPFFRYMKDIVHQFLGSLVVQLRQCVMSPPSVIGIVIGPCCLIVEIKVIPIRAVSTDIGTLVISFRILIDALSVHPFIKGTTVIEHAIQNDSHVSAVCLCHHLSKQLVAGFQIRLVSHTVDVTGSKTVLPLSVGKQIPFITDNLSNMGINIIIILNIVFVVGRGDKQRIKINHLNSQILQVVHLIQHTLQVSAVELTDIHLCGITSPVLYAVYRFSDVAIFIGQHIIGRISITETIRIDLVHDRSLGPVGGVETGNDNEIIIFINFLHQAPHIKDAGNSAGLHLKIIRYLLIIQTHYVGIIVKIIFALHTYHKMLLSAAYQEHSVHIISGGPEADRHFGKTGRLFRNHIFRTGICKKCSPVKYRSHGRNVLLIIFCST